MNKVRLGKLRNARELIDRCASLVEACEEEESDAMDNIPENLQSGELYMSMEDNVERMQDILTRIEECQELFGEF